MLLLPSALLLAGLFQDIASQDIATQDLSPQDVAPIPMRPSGVRRLNRVEIAVNNEVITLAELVAVLRVAQERQPVSSPEEDAAMRSQIAMARVMELLLVQAGEDLGRPTEEIDAIVNDWWEHLIDRAGGAREYSESLQKDEKDSLQQREQLTNEIYSYSYTRVVTGLDPGPQGRPYVDRYLRPGTIRRVYDQMVRNGVGLEEIQGQSKTFVLQQIALEARDQEDLERKYKQAQDLRERALAGEDFNALVDAYSELTGNRSITTGIKIGALANFGRDAFEWARTAEEESISPVVPVIEPESRGVIGWRVLRVMDVQAAVVPSFDSIETQMRLEALLRGQRDERLRSLALQDLLEVAYVYPDNQLAQAEIDQRLQRARAEIGGTTPAAVPPPPTPPREEVGPLPADPPPEKAPPEKAPPEGARPEGPQPEGDGAAGELPAETPENPPAPAAGGGGR